MDVNIKAIFAVMNTAQAVVKIRPEKTCRPVQACMLFFHFFLFFFHASVIYTTAQVGFIQVQSF